LVDVICDTSFLIHLATRKIKNLDSIYTEIGNIEFVIPLVVLNELEQLTKRPNKQDDASKTLEFVRDMKNIEISGKFADNAILEHIKKHGGMVATMDEELKNKIKNLKGTIISFSNDKIVLEP
jgi:rRNA-processing protein FCF1